MNKAGMFSACRFSAAADVAAVAVVAVVLAAGILVVAAGTVTAAAVVASPPPEPTELNWSRRPVLFSHQTHLNAPALRSRTDATKLPPERPDGGEVNNPPIADTGVCVLCHHRVNGVTHYLTCATQDCHDNLNPKHKSVRSYYLATHAAPKGIFYSCVACHTEQAGDDALKIKRMAGCEESACHK
ncbi:MAG: cytochrome c3 family protein [Desulfovibrio sp.]|jgi:hypothetical protein|nr:cytochrome c3 family protein [Desulfovibrio sp.]